jgi:predicted oxidoreductase
MTLGGLMTRVTGEVMTPAGEVLPGLYAAGRATSCLSAQSCGSSGLQVGEGTFFGRLAGQSAAGERAV